MFLYTGSVWARKTNMTRIRHRGDGKVGTSGLLIHERHVAFGASTLSLLQIGLATSLSVAEDIGRKLSAAAAEDIIETKARIGHFIGQVYNQKRSHSALGYLTSAEFEKQDLS